MATAISLRRLHPRQSIIGELLPQRDFLNLAGRGVRDFVNEHDVVSMRDQLFHRGPDSDGVYVSPGARAGIAFRRLRIIDLSANASQPKL